MKQLLIFIVFFFVTATLSSQSLEVTYLKKEKIDITDFTRQGVPEALQGKYKQYLKNRRKMERYYLLTYTSGKSKYEFQRVEHASSKMQMTNTTTYKNLQAGEIYTSGGILKPSEAIKRNIKKEYNWIYEKETREILGYKCLKAYYIKKNDDKVTVWYSQGIPIIDGPSIYAGVPGLILQVEEKKSTITATNIKELKSSSQMVTIPDFTDFISFEEYRKSVLNSHRN